MLTVASIYPSAAPKGTAWTYTTAPAAGRDQGFRERVVQYEAPDKVRGLYRRPTFYLQIPKFLEWSRGESKP